MEITEKVDIVIKQNAQIIKCLRGEVDLESEICRVVCHLILLINELKSGHTTWVGIQDIITQSKNFKTSILIGDPDQIEMLINQLHLQGVLAYNQQKTHISFIWDLKI